MALARRRKCLQWLKTHPCGFLGDPKRECRCAAPNVQRYRNRISGPLLDRIDIHVEVPAVRYQELASTTRGESSAAIRERVIRARRLQQERFRGHARVHCNAAMRSKELHKHCALGDEAQETLKRAITDLNFSARAYDRILKVARTIADLAGTEQIENPHIAEAIQYRSLDRQYWV